MYSIINHHYHEMVLLSKLMSSKGISEGLQMNKLCIIVKNISYTYRPWAHWNGNLHCDNDSINF